MNYDVEDLAREERLDRHLEKMKQEKKRYLRRVRILKTGLCIGIPLACILVIVIVVVKSLRGNSEMARNEASEILEESVGVISENQVLSAQVEVDLSPADIYPYAKSEPEAYGIYAENTFRQTERTAYLGVEEVVSEYGILVDADTGEIIAQRDANVRMNPASMTKILTLLVAVEHIEDLEDTVVIDIETTDYAYSNDLSAVGFALDEVVTVRDLLYGTILCSGADAGYALAKYVAGSEEEFVALMNEKLVELGLDDSAHMTNCVGMYGEAHYCTVTDMAVILKAAESNALCREVLGAHIYTTSATPEHPEGIEISNWFLRRIEDHVTGGVVQGAKTGFVVQSKNCAASYYVADEGKQYICVTGGSSSAWRCIFDHVDIYSAYVP